MFKRLLTIILVSGFVVVVGFSATGDSDVTASVFDGVTNFLENFSNPSQVEDLNNQDDSQPLYKPVMEYETAVVDAVESSAPSVVSIAITKDLQTMERCRTNPFSDLPQEYQDLFGNFEVYEPCPGEIRNIEVGGGSGFIASSDGLIVTNKHVVMDDQASYTVVTNKGDKYEAEVLDTDPVQDIAILQIDAEDLNPAELGSSESLKLGQTAIAIGNALGEFQNTVSVGVISGLSRDITAAASGGFVERISDVIQTDAAINQGNSGGPLLNLRGEVIGLNTAIARGAQNIGFAIPVDRVKRDIESVRRTGEIKTPFLGVRYLPVTDQLVEQENLPVDYGALVRGTENGEAVMPDSAAAEAGIQEGDIITNIGDTRIDSENTLGTIIQKYNVGDEVDVEVIRGEDTLVFTVQLDERPEL